MKINDLKLITEHPLNQSQKIASIMRYFGFGLRNKFSSEAFAFPFVNNVKLWVSSSSTSAMLQYYNGLNDWEEMSFLLHFLREDGLFVDVGANIGVYSVLAAGVTKTNTIAIEPGSAALKAFQKNIDLNGLEKRIELATVAVGKEQGTVSFTQSLDAINRVERKEDSLLKLMEVPMSTLDVLLHGKEPSLLKIDVEGFELNVLQGGRETLKKKSLKAILIETNGLAEKYGLKEEEVHQIIREEGFERYTYDPFLRKLSLIDKNMRLDNSLYIRDVETVAKLLKQAPRFQVRGQEV